MERTKVDGVAEVVFRSIDAERLEQARDRIAKAKVSEPSAEAEQTPAKRQEQSKQRQKQQAKERDRGMEL